MLILLSRAFDELSIFILLQIIFICRSYTRALIVFRLYLSCMLVLEKKRRRLCGGIYRELCREAYYPASSSI